MPLPPSPAPRPRTRWLGPLGWITGVLSVLLDAAGLGAVLCLWFPSVLTTPELREIHVRTFDPTAGRYAEQRLGANEMALFLTGMHHVIDEASDVNRLCV